MKRHEIYSLLTLPFSVSLDKNQPIQVHRPDSCIALCHKLHLSRWINGLRIRSYVSNIVRHSDSNQILALWYVLNEKKNPFQLTAIDRFTNRFIWFFSRFVYKLLDVWRRGKSSKSTRPIRTVYNSTESIFHSNFIDCIGSILPSNLQTINHIENCIGIWSRTIEWNARSMAQILIDRMHHFLFLHW